MDGVGDDDGPYTDDTVEYLVTTDDRPIMEIVQQLRSLLAEDGGGTWFSALSPREWHRVHSDDWSLPIATMKALPRLLAEIERLHEGNPGATIS